MVMWPFIRIVVIAIVVIVFVFFFKKKDVFDLAWDAKEKRDFHSAIDLYNTIIEKHPDNWIMHLYRGQCKVGTGDKAGAESDFQKAIKLNPKHSGQAKAELDKLKGV
jgi:predicted Zn-dependent protease